MDDTKANGATSAGQAPVDDRPSWRHDVVRLLIIAGAALAVVTITTGWSRWTESRREQVTDDAYLQSDLTPLSVHVSGYVRSVPVSDYAFVEEGQTIATLVDDDYRALVAQAEANVAAAQAQIQNIAAQRTLQLANVESAAALVDATAATLERNQLEARRQQTLVQSGAGTPQSVEQSSTAERNSSAQMRQTRAQLLAAHRQLEVLAAQDNQAQAALAAQRAALTLARLNLGYTEIKAPVSGMLGLRLIRPGQFVSVGQQVIQIAPLPHVWVIANYKETQITHMRVGQPASVVVDAFSDHPLAGHVESYAPASGSQFALLPPDNATGNFTKVVQRISVKIALDNTRDLGMLLRPGMSVVARVDTQPTGRTSP